MAKPLPTTSSTWTLLDTREHVDRDTEPRLDPSRKDTADEPGPQDPSAPDPQEGRPRDQPNPPIQDPPERNRTPSPQPEDKVSRLKRAVRKVKKFVKSEYVLALRKHKDSLYAVVRAI